MKWWDALSRLAGILAETGSSELAGGAGALVGVLLIAMFARMPLVRPVEGGGFRAGVSALRSRAVRTGVPRHRDPDAPGRTRPRGPTGPLAVA
ncbi:DUF6412 domain-containing protein [Actinoplanes couchii]|uniref:Uncharacterized protein n=1 Tax=Actinoplanes couchii TaxID=403638 RepID=A0ABQ3X1V7_9ACTN|nr:DUF6412 domain-containing protein [Actinoplanes couchii]MDR6316788.1 hypothetical protein [Actinoplanes couchii]GID52395.1 hypothetical protein Aco03nite_007990 [Actinoplanes couchii]